MDMETVIRGIPLFHDKDVSCEPLNGGLSNETYKLTCEGKAYVLRVFGRQADYLALTRGSEIELIRAFHREIHSPAVLYADPGETFAVLEYIEGRMANGDDLLDDERSRRIVTRLKEIHQSVDIAAVSARPCSPYQLVERYLSGADRLHVKRPHGLSPLLTKMEQIAYRRSFDKTHGQRFCHNDYYLFNLIWTLDGADLVVVDWELSGVGDVFFDLASIPFTNRFTPEQEKQWLHAYFGYYEEEQYAILQDMKYMNMLRECAWGLLHSGMTHNQVNHDFNYYQHAERVIERLQQGYNAF
ncbi:phosphotransferase [Paenibacillus methanolicus]|uniref:Thiamine kinase-like enzyme n=1 Tax=Paenibacillus methanolicus TaxID=582686 RepID=A0A5S5CIV7_9BACL|nr:phosphotransferase [Paenibacillus methanolicus]TYP78953.1 thiamine kinase-like enzyme [Paenibacillus methanolicus]